MVALRSGLAPASLTVGTSTSEIPDVGDRSTSRSRRAAGPGCSGRCRSCGSPWTALTALITPASVASLAAIAASRTTSGSTMFTATRAIAAVATTSAISRARRLHRRGGTGCWPRALGRTGGDRRGTGGTASPDRRGRPASPASGADRAVAPPLGVDHRRCPSGYRLSAAGRAARSRTRGGCGSAARRSRRPCAAGRRCRWRRPSRRRRSRCPTPHPAVAGGTARRWR